jgi:hypothetical protein
MSGSSGVQWNGAAAASEVRSGQVYYSAEV